MTEHVNVSLGAMALPVDAIGIGKDNITGEIVVKVAVSMGSVSQNFEVIRVTAPEGGGVLSHWTTALGMRGKIHKATDGCDMETLVDRKGKLVVSPCRRPNHV